MFRRIDSVLLTLAGTMIGVILLCTCLQVVFRYFLHDSLVWAEELSRYLFVWATFIAAAVLVGRGEHYAMPELVESLSPGMQRVLGLIVTLLCVAFCIVMVYYGTRWAWRLRDADTPVLELPQGAIYAIVPISGAYMALRLLIGADRPQAARPDTEALDLSVGRERPGA